MAYIVIFCLLLCGIVACIFAISKTKNRGNDMFFTDKYVNDEDVLNLPADIAAGFASGTDATRPNVQDMAKIILLLETLYGQGNHGLHLYVGGTLKNRPTEGLEVAKYVLQRKRKLLDAIIALLDAAVQDKAYKDALMASNEKGVKFIYICLAMLRYGFSDATEFSYLYATLLGVNTPEDDDNIKAAKTDELVKHMLQY